MTLRNRWRDWPWDVRLAYKAVVSFAAWHAMIVVVGPNIFLWASELLIYPAMAVIALFGAFRLIRGPQRMCRGLPVILVTAYLVTFYIWNSELTTDLHLVGRVYMAGGPKAVNEWAQGLILEQRTIGKSREVEGDAVPAGIRRYLTNYVRVEGPYPDQDAPPWVRMELGGGFYHFGVAVFSTAGGESPNMWQRAIGWPPELVVYHEN